MGRSKTASAAGQSECWSTSCEEIPMSEPVAVVLSGMLENPDIVCMYVWLYVCILRARVQPTLDPYAEAFL